jgi:outer membrane protein TolC
MTYNHDLRIAAANVKEARALRRLTAFDLAPTVQANGGCANTLLSQAAAAPGVPRSAREFQILRRQFRRHLRARFFGRVRRSVQAANAPAGRAEANRLDVLVSVTAEVARNWLRAARIAKPTRRGAPECGGARPGPQRSLNPASKEGAAPISMSHEAVRCLT